MENLVEILEVKIDVSKLSNEELHQLRKEARNIISAISFELVIRQKQARQPPS